MLLYPGSSKTKLCLLVVGNPFRYLEPPNHPCFGWSSGLLLEGSGFNLTPKIEDIHMFQVYHPKDHLGCLGCLIALTSRVFFDDQTSPSVVCSFFTPNHLDELFLMMDKPPPPVG